VKADAHVEERQKGKEKKRKEGISKNGANNIPFILLLPTIRITTRK
jgi:hypothetical protein